MRFRERLYNFLLRRVGSPADAEDLTQDAFVRAWERISTYKPGMTFSTWLFTIALRQAAAEYRRRRPTAALGVEHHGSGREEDPADGTADREEARRVWAMADEVLTPDQRSAVWLRYAEGMSVCDIASVMRRSHVGVRVLLFRARERLARGMETESSEPVTVESPAARPALARSGSVGGVL